MSANLAPLRLATPRPTLGEVEVIRDRIAGRCQGFAAAYPEALDLHAEALATLHDRLAGKIAKLSGLHSGRFLRSALDGRDALPLCEFMRLFTEAEAGDAADAVLRVLAHARGWALVPRVPRWLEPLDVAAQYAIVSPHAAAAIIHAFQNDGRIDQDEARALIPHRDALHEAGHAVDGLIQASEGQA